MGRKLSKSDLYQLNKYVKRGWLSKGTSHVQSSEALRDHHGATGMGVGGNDESTNRLRV